MNTSSAQLLGVVARAHGGGGTSTAAIVVAVLAGLVALACVAWALARACGCCSMPGSSASIVSSGTERIVER